MTNLVLVLIGVVFGFPFALLLVLVLLLTQVFMISYMVDGQGFLIISREVVSEDIEVCMCALHQ